MRTTVPSNQPSLLHVLESRKICTRSPTRMASLITLFASMCKIEETCTDHDYDPAVDRPLRVASHITSGQDVDALQEENRPAKDDHYGDDLKNEFHGCPFSK